MQKRAPPLARARAAIASDAHQVKADELSSGRIAEL